MRCRSCNALLSEGHDHCPVCRSPVGSRSGERDAPPGPFYDLPRTGPHPPRATDTDPEDLHTGPPPPISHRSSARPVGPQREIPTEFLTVDPERVRETRMVEVSIPGVVRRATRQREREGKPRQASAKELEDPVEAAIRGARLGYARLHRLDRMALWTLIFGVVAAFLPWTSVPGEGLVSGIEGYGAASAAAAALAMLCIYRRARRRAGSALFLLLQLVASAAIAAAPLYWVISDPSESRLSIGLALTALAGLCAAVLTLARFTRINV